MIYLTNGRTPRLPARGEKALIKPNERRRFERVELRADLRYQPRGSGSEFVSAVLNNVSIGGIGFNINRFLAPSTTLNLEFDLLSRVLHPVGRVAWCYSIPHSDRNSLGVEFVELDPIEKCCLESFIKMQTGQL